MNVVYAANDAYAQHLAVSLCSLCDRNRDERELNIAVLSVGIREASLRKLRETAGRFGRSLTVAELSPERMKQDFGGTPDTGRFDVSTMGRLFLGELLPEEWDKVLYLDCDTVVLRPLGALWRRGLKAGNRLAGKTESSKRPVMAAVQEPTIYREVKEYLGMGEAEPYFNAGVLLLDLAAFRREDLFRKVRAYYGTVAEKSLFNDQDALNGCPELKGRIRTLPPAFNFFTNYRYFRYKTLCAMQADYGRQVSKRAFSRAKRYPAVVHYAGSERPWVAGAMNFYGRGYDRYLAMTPYAGAPKQEGKRLSMLLYHGMELLTVLSPGLRAAVSQAYIRREIRARREKQGMRKA